MTASESSTIWPAGQTRTLAISGSSGLVAKALLQAIPTGAAKVQRLVRRPPQGTDEVLFDWERNAVDLAPLQGIDAVIHLAGENIAGGRWNAERKRRILESRELGTRRLCEALAKLEHPPRTLICASAVGYYGEQGDKQLTESDPSGAGFLAGVCQAWEKGTQPAVDRGMRVVNLRIGVVLSKDGGALKSMIFPFRLGLGGRVGSGKQYWSWVSLADLVGMIQFALFHEELSGPVNCVGPEPVTNLEFTKTLGQILHRPTIFPMPAFAARLVLGEMADELLLTSSRVLPVKLEQSGYPFQHRTLESALRAEF